MGKDVGVDGLDINQRAAPAFAKATEEDKVSNWRQPKCGPSYKYIEAGSPIFDFGVGKTQDLKMCIF